jgi:NAD kinase
VSHLFPKGVPPVLSFALGTVGFLTSFPFASHEHHLKQMVEGNMFLSLRTRMRCKLYSFREGAEELVGTYAVLNEVAVNRAPSCNLVTSTCSVTGSR